MEAESSDIGRWEAGDGVRRAILDGGSGDADPLALVRARTDAAGDGCTVEGSQQRILLGQGVDLVRIGLGTPSPPLEKTSGPVRDPARRSLPTPRDGSRKRARCSDRLRRPGRPPDAPEQVRRRPGSLAHGYRDTLPLGWDFQSKRDQHFLPTLHSFRKLRGHDFET